MPNPESLQHGPNTCSEKLDMPYLDRQRHVGNDCKYISTDITDNDRAILAPIPGTKLSLSQSNPALTATIVICTRNRAEELDACLHAIAQLHYPQYEVLVVENGPPDGRTRAVAEGHGVRYLSSPRIGLSRARNDGARACTTDLVAYIDDDARPHPDWLAGLACEFADPLVMAAGGSVLLLPGEGDGDAPAASNATTGPHNRQIVDLQSPNWFALTNFGGIGDGCNMCFRRSAFELWPGFDERLGRGAPLDSAEDHFCFFQLVLLGYRCVHAPQAVVWHGSLESPSEWRRHNFANLTNAVSYSALLWTEFPRTRRLLIKHLWSRSFGQRSHVRAASGVPRLSLGDKLGIVAAGLRLYWRLPKPDQSVPLIASCASRAS
jgi:GT2 family glycosyltransferase